MSEVKNRMYELLSALQKCIRRGLEEDALHWALQLEENFHYNMVWNDLKTIASEDIGLANPLMPILIETLYNQYKVKKDEEKAPKIDSYGDEEREKRPCLIFLANAVLCLCRSPHSRIADDFLHVVQLEREKGKLLGIPDFALDKHTARGREMGRGWEHFFSEGSKVVNEPFENPYKERHRKLRGV